MNASPASPACAATGTPPRDTGVRGTDRHVLHLRAGPVAPAVGRLVVGEGAGGQSSKVIVHRARWCQASRACVQGTPSQVKGRGRYRASNFWLPLQGGLKHLSHAADPGKPRGGRRVAGRATNCAGFATVTRDRYRVVPAGEPGAREAEANGSQHKVL